MREFKTLTVGQLKKLLENHDDDTPVTTMVSYGDRANTMQAVGLGEVEMVNLTETSYSDSGYQVVEEGEGEQEVLCLNYDSWKLC